MALNVIPLAIKGKIISYGDSNDTTLYAFLFYKYGDTTQMIDGVKAVYSVEASQIANLSTQIAYGVYINPVIDESTLVFKVNYLGYQYVGYVDTSDTEAISGEKFITFINTEVEDRLLPIPEEGDAGKVPTVQEDLSYALEEISSEDPRIPTPTPQDVGKYLKVDSDGHYFISDPGGGDIPGGYKVTLVVNNEEYTIVSVPQGGSMAEPLAPSVQGQFFKGWTINGTSKVTFPYTPVADTVMSAMLEQNITIGFTGLTREDGALTLTDDIAHVGEYQIIRDTQYDVVSNPLDNYFPFSEMNEFTDSEGNVFVKIPLMYMKWIDDENGLIDGVKFSNHKVDDNYFIPDAFLDNLDTSGSTFCDYIGIGKYEAYGTGSWGDSSTNSKIFSMTNVTVKTDTTGYAFGAASYRDRTREYQALDVQVWTLFTLLCLMFYRTSNIQTVASGRVNESSAITTTGSCDIIAGKNGWNNGSNCVKMLGIENPYGNLDKYFNNLQVPSQGSGNYYIYNRSGNGAIEVGSYTSWAVPASGYIIGYKHGSTNNIRSLMLPYSTGGSASTYCGDYYSAGTQNMSQTPACGGAYNSGDGGGLLRFQGNTYYNKSYCTSRLCYKHHISA